jgi:hypothetical protein
MKAETGSAAGVTERCPARIAFPTNVMLVPDFATSRVLRDEFAVAIKEPAGWVYHNILTRHQRAHAGY